MCDSQEEYFLFSIYKFSEVVTAFTNFNCFHQ